MTVRSIAPSSGGRGTWGDEARLARYASQRDPHDLEALVLRYRPLAHGLAHRYSGRLRSMDDLCQVACVGLIKALQRFDPDRGCPFTAYAVPTILGELRRFCRDTNWSVHVPRGMQERILAARRTGDELTAACGRTATVAEVAEALGWECEMVVEALVAGTARSTVSLETEVGDAADPCRLVEILGDADPGFALVESLTSLEQSLGALTRAEKRVLRLRFEEDLGFHEIASRLGLGESQVARLLTSALHGLRRELGVADGDLEAGDRLRAPAPVAARRWERPVEALAGRAA